MTPRTSSDPRRRSILEAGLKCFNTDGYDTASVEDICRISGASVGSVYHHFGNKAGIAAALYEEGIASYQTDLMTVLAGEDPPAQVIAAIVRHHLDWVRKNPGWARFLLQMGTAPATAAARPVVKEHNQALIEQLERWSAPHIAAGTVLDASPLTLTALVLGPCHAAARAWLAGGLDLDQPAIQTIADAVVRSVQAN